MATALEHLHHRRLPDAGISDDHNLRSQHQRRSVTCLHASDSALDWRGSGSRGNRPRHDLACGRRGRRGRRGQAR